MVKSNRAVKDRSNKDTDDEVMSHFNMLVLK